MTVWVLIVHLHFGGADVPMFLAILSNESECRMMAAKMDKQSRPNSFGGEHACQAESVKTAGATQK